MPVLGLPPAELARRAKAKKLKALGINIYGGGFTLGVLHHFDVIGQWEEINLGRRTFDLNFGGRIPRPLKREEWQPHDLTGKDLVEIRGQVPLHQERKLNDGLLSLARQTAPGRSLRHTLAHLEDWRPHAINYQINSKHYPTGD